MDVGEFFAGYATSRQIFDVVLAAAADLGPFTLRVTKSQVALIRDKAFAWAWMPEVYLKRKAAPLVLTFSFRERRPWSRWKEITEASPGRFTHHLELWLPEDVDEVVRVWLKGAWDAAG